jgi:hypothetical protein
MENFYDFLLKPARLRRARYVLILPQPRTQYNPPDNPGHDKLPSKMCVEIFT